MEGQARRWKSLAVLLFAFILSGSIDESKSDKDKNFLCFNLVLNYFHMCHSFFFVLGVEVGWELNCRCQYTVAITSAAEGGGRGAGDKVKAVFVGER